MTSLADAVLPLVRTRADLHRWSAANRHGAQMHEAVDMLQAAAPDAPPRELYAVTHKALASAISVIARADDSSGIIGHAVRRLLELHPSAAEAAGIPAARLVAWMMDFQFDGAVDFFTLDPVAYAPALGDDGMRRYRAALDERRAALGPPADDDRTAGFSHERFTVEWNDQRLAVHDRDVEAIIATHARDRRVAAWFEDTAVALAEIGEIDLALDWARQGMEFDRDYQSRQCAARWCRLLAEHRPDELLTARMLVFRRWPTAEHAGRLYTDAGAAWPAHHDEVLTALAARPRECVTFVLHTLRDPERAWTLAHDLELDDDVLWAGLADAYATVDPLAVLSVHARLTLDDLQVADAKRYRAAARRLARMRTLAAGSDQLGAVDELIARLREEHRRRPRLQQEFDRAGLPA